MARKLDPNTPRASAPEPTVSDMAVMHPDIELTLAGREVTVREYRFLDGMRARVKAKALIDELETYVADGSAAEAGVEDYVELLARHSDLVRELMLDSIDGADAAWLDALPNDAGTELLLTWWGVCGRFFVQVVAARLRDRLLATARRAAFAGPTSSPTSALPATATPSPSSATTPSAS